MPRVIVKQPNGKFAVWSTIVDDFVYFDSTESEVVAEEVNDKAYDNYPGGITALMRDINQELANIASTGKAWPWAPDWDEAIETIRMMHDDATADERIKMGSY